MYLSKNAKCANKCSADSASFKHSDGCIIISLLTLEAIHCKDLILCHTVGDLSNAAAITGLVNFTLQHLVVLVKISVYC